MSGDFHIIDDEPDDPLRPNAEEDRLNFARIRALAQDRRAAYRRLFWARAIVFLFACMTMMTAVEAARSSGSRRAWFFTGAAIFAILALRAFRRPKRFALASTRQSDPPPDPAALAKLSDGSQFSKRLDELRDS